MTVRNYPWRRFWCPRGAEIRLDTAGYLLDPADLLGSIQNPEVVSFSSLDSHPCLVLLGEPGIGKTYEIQLIREARETEVKAAGDAWLYRHLATYTTDVALVQDVFEHETMRNWRGGTNRLFLYLDGFDECPLPRNSLVKLLGERLGTLDRDRLSLRIVSRTANWPARLEEELTRLWAPGPSVYELLGLRRNDVLTAAVAHGLDPEVTLRAIEGRGLVPLASRPITLEQLLNRFDRSGADLPGGQAELFLDACGAMCDETDPDRHPPRPDALSRDERLRLAGRLALITLTSGRAAIWTEPDRGEVPGSDVTVAALARGTEVVDGRELQVREAAVREVLGTSLFTARGASELGWAHQVYAEFLAAWYLSKRAMPAAQVASLLTHPSGEGQIVPQLREIAAWAAALMPEVFDVLIGQDPGVLLRSDVAMSGDPAKAEQLVELLLTLRSAKAAIAWGWDLHRRLRLFSHERLAQQLQLWIFDRTRDESARELAIELANANQLRELVDTFAPIARDPTEPQRVRVSAAWTIAQTGSRGGKAQLRAILDEDTPSEELRGAALSALWPGHIDATTMFASLRRPEANVFGLYQMFLSRDLVRNLAAEDLGTAVTWARDNVGHGRSYHFDQLIDEIVARAAQESRDARVLDDLAIVVEKRIEDSHRVFSGREENTDPFAAADVRRSIAERILKRAAKPRDAAVVLRMSSPALLRPPDVSWALERLAAENDDGARASWLEVLEYCFDWHDLERAAELWKAYDEDRTRFARFAPYFEAVDISSENAREMRRWHRESEGRQPSRLQPSSSERVASALERAEQDAGTWWWVIDRELQLEPTSATYDHEFESDLTALPGWKSAAEPTRQRILALAPAYLRARDPKTADWIGTNTWNFPAAAGYRALRLLAAFDRESLEGLEPEVWRRWAAAIISFPQSGAEDSAVQEQLLTRAYAHAPAELRDALGRIIDQENEAHGTAYVIHRLGNIWDAPLADHLRAKLLEPQAKPGTFADLLEVLVEHGDAAAMAYARQLVQGEPADDPERERRLVAARVLLMHPASRGWETVWPAIERDPELGREAIVAAVSRVGRRTVPRHLAEAELADLYIWLARTYPPGEDPARPGGLLTARMQIADFRDAILDYLVSLGTPASLEAVQRIRAQLSGIAGLDHYVDAARETTMQRSWQAPAPSDIIALLSEHDRRIVQSGEQLLALLEESLARLQQRLRGETPLARFLWNEWPIPGDPHHRMYQPKAEADFADFVKSHLDADLRERSLIASREVEIRRGAGGVPGERTDIYVTAIHRTTGTREYERVRAIVEVKGSWHAELRKALPAQLVDRYLRDNDCRYGLYLVGWFNCDQWDAGDGRRGVAIGRDRDVLSDELQGQATEVAERGLTVRVVVLDCAIALPPA